MIYSDSDSTTKIPMQYIMIHDYCCDLLTGIVPFLTDSEFDELVKLEFNLNQKTFDKLEKMTEVQMLEWLNKNGYKKEYKKFYLIRTFKAILADFTEYIEFSLIGSRRSRLNVALNLLRKPFIENLIVLERLLVNPDEFIESFTSEGPNKYNPAKEPNKVDLIKKCIKHLNNPFFNADLIYTLRHDKNNPNSYYAISNQAVHLVTTWNESYRTNEKDFNFVFIPETAYNDFWYHYYNFVPMLLYYSVEIIEHIVNREVKQKKEEFLFRKLIRLIGFLFVSELLYPKQAKTSSALDKLSGTISIKCPNCKKDNTLYKSDFYDLYSTESICCKHCLTNMVEDKNILSELYEAI